MRSHQKVLFEHATVQHGRIPLMLHSVSFPIILLFNFSVLSAEQSLPSQVHTHEMLRIGAFYGHSSPGKANVHPACSIVMGNFGGPSAIAIVLVNVLLVFIGKLLTVAEGKKARNSISAISKIQADKRIRGYCSQ